MRYYQEVKDADGDIIEIEAEYEQEHVILTVDNLFDNSFEAPLSPDAAMALAEALYDAAGVIMSEPPVNIEEHAHVHDIDGDALLVTSLEAFANVTINQGGNVVQVAFDDADDLEEIIAGLQAARDAILAGTA